MTEAEAEDRAVDLITDIAMSKVRKYEGDGSGFVGWVSALMRNLAQRGLL